VPSSRNERLRPFVQALALDEPLRANFEAAIVLR